MTQFWKPQPRAPIAPEDSWIARTLKLSGYISVAGWAIYGLFAFAFDDIRVIPDDVQSVLAIIGSALIVAGAELNTPPTGVAVAHKIGRKKAHWLDIVAFVVSGVGSLFSIWIMFALRQSLGELSGWRLWMQVNGPLAAGVATAADYIAAIIEQGLLQADYEQSLEEWSTKMEDWRQEEQAWNEEHGIAPQVDRSDWPQADVRDFRRLLASMNGNRAELSKESLQAHLDPMQRVEPSPSTIDRWFREEM